MYSQWKSDMKVKFLIAVLLIFFCTLSHSQTDTTTNKSSSSLSQSSAASSSSTEAITPLSEEPVKNTVPVQKTYKIITDLVSAGKLNPSLANNSIEFINKLLEEKRLDSDGIYKFTRSVRDNLIATIDYLRQNNSGDPHFQKLDACLSDAMKMTEKLRDISYVDDIHSNKNLAYFIETRLNNLVASSAVLAARDEATTYRRLLICDDFKQELGIVEDKYRDSFRFRAGVGLNYSYLPSIRYFNSGEIDVSAYQANPDRMPTHFAYGNRFADQGYPGFMLMADIGLMGVNLTIPDYSVESDITLPVRVINSLGGENGTPQPFALYQTSINSELTIDYDGYIRADAVRIVDYIFDRNYSQISAGVLYGAVGFALEDEIVSDLRFVNGQQPFNDLAPSKEYKQKLSESYISQYWGLFARLNLTDEWMLSLDYKAYLNDYDNQDRVEVGGRSFGFSVLYIPTGF
jgi:hypothetical protein